MHTNETELKFQVLSLQDFKFKKLRDQNRFDIQKAQNSSESFTWQSLKIEVKWQKSAYILQH